MVAIDTDEIDAADWEKAQAEYTNPAGANASERVVTRIAAARRMGEIEARWEHLPGGFQAVRERYREHKERIRRIADGIKLSDEQLVRIGRASCRERV